MSTYWHHKVAMVTGASSGLGKAIAQALAVRGARVVIAARGAAALEATAAELSAGGATVVPVVADVTSDEDVDRLIDETITRFGRLDLLVNNAGRSARGEVLATTPEQFRELLELNLIATVRVTRAAAPHLLAARGHLVNIGSLASKSAARYLGAYPASKFAVAAYTQQLRLELGPKGLQVLLVCPGPIARDAKRDYLPADSQLPESARQPGGGVQVKQIAPEWLAAELLRAAERGKSELVVPAKARLLFALAQLSPRLGDWILRRKT